MRIWIDLVNSPHVSFFIPIIERLKQQGHSLVITYRDFAQTAQLVEAYGLPATLIGGHGGKSKAGKIYNLLSRTWQLYRFAKTQKFDLVITHNSYFQLAAARLLGIPSLTSMDFEGQPANHIAFRLATAVSVPEQFPELALKKFGARKVFKYRGLKEHICLSDFSPEPGFIERVREAFGLPEGDMTKPLILVRPPPVLALYHNGNESAFDAVLEKLARSEAAVLLLPRTEQQRHDIITRYPCFYTSATVLNGLQLVNVCDLVISGGGSMNREAACLGVPAISVYSGPLPAVDAWLQQRGALSVVSNRLQADALIFEKKEPSVIGFDQQAVSDFMYHIERIFEEIQ